MTYILGTVALVRIEEEFPELAEEFREHEGLLHLLIAAFSHLAQAFIDTGNTLQFERVCQLFVSFFPHASSELENALNVSFLEHLNFTDGKRKELGRTPKCLR